MRPDHPTTTTGRPSRAALVPAALAVRLGLAEWQVLRAERDQLIPVRDRSRGWSAALADQLAVTFVGDRDELLSRIGRVPDMGTWDTAAHLAARYGVEDGPGLRDAVRELAHLRVLTIRYWDRSFPVYDGRSIEAVTDPTVITAAGVSGATLTADQAAGRLGVRRVDFDHAVRAGLIGPCRWVRTYYTSRHRDPGMWLYRTADVNALAARTDIDWPTVRATRKGGRSLLAVFPTVKE